MWQSDLENTNEKPLHKPSQDQRKSTALGGAQKFGGTVHTTHNVVLSKCMLNSHSRKLQ